MPAPPAPAPEAPAADVGHAFPLIPLVEGETGPSRWKSRRDAAGSVAGAAEFSGRRVDLPVASEDQIEDESRKAAEAIETGIASGECTEIHGNGPDQLFAKYRGSFHRLNVRFSNESDYNEWIKRQVDIAEAVVTYDDIRSRRRGIFQRADGSSMTVMLPPFVQASTFSIRKHTIGHWTAENLVENGTMSQNMVNYLRAAVQARANILIVGQMGSGKSSALSILTREFSPNERIAVIEEIPEIHVAQPQVSYFVYQPMQEDLSLTSILDSSLYMRFDRVIVGEVHLEGITKMLEVWMTGSDGSFSTYHSDSAARAIERMKLALQLENPNMTAETSLALIRQAVDIIVVLDRAGGQHRCMEITEIDWRESSGAAVVGRNELFAFNAKDGVHVAKGKPDEHGKVARKFLKHGVPVRDEWFATTDIHMHYR